MTNTLFKWALKKDPLVLNRLTYLNDEQDYFPSNQSIIVICILYSHLDSRISVMFLCQHREILYLLRDNILGTANDKG